MPPTLPDPIEWSVKAFRNDGRNDQYLKYRDYLDGKHPLQFATPKYQSAFGRLLDALAYDRTNMVVDAHADRLQVAGWSATQKGIASQTEDLWNDNHMDRREGEIEVEAFGMGDGYAVVEKHPRTGKVHIWANDATDIRVYYSMEEPGKVEFAVKAWKLDTKYVRLNVYRPGKIEKYISRNKSHGDMLYSAGVFERYQPETDLTWPVTLDVPDVVPVFHFANNARTGRYGVSELLHVLPMQDALNKTIGDLMVAMEFGAFPQKILLGVDNLPPPTTPEGIEARKKLSQFELGIDRILTVIGANAKAAEFQAVALAQFIACAEYFDNTVSRVSRVPLHYFSTDEEAESGVARRLKEAPFVAKIVDRQRAFGEVYGNMMHYALRLGGVADPGTITPIWQSAAPLSVEDELDIAMKKQAIGVPLEYVLKGLTEYDEDDIANIIDLAKASAELARRQFNRGVFAPNIEDDTEGEAG